MSPKAKRNLGLVFLILPVLLVPVLVLFAIASFASRLATSDAYVSGNGEALGTLIGNVVRTGLGIFGILAVVGIILIPLGLYLASRYSQGFSIGQAWHMGWEGTKKNFWLFIGVGVLFVIPAFIPGLAAASGVPEAISIALHLLLIVFYVLIAPGFLHMTIRAARGEQASFATIWSGVSQAAALLGGGILYGLLVLGGMILLVVPGIIWAFKYSLYAYYIVDKDMGVWDAMKASAEATRGAKWDLFTWIVLAEIITMIAMLPFLLGLIIVLPIVVIGRAHIYLQLSGQFGVPMRPTSSAGSMNSVPPQAYL